MKLSSLLASALQLLGASSMCLAQTTGQIETNDGIELEYTQSGPPSGQPLLFIPGWRQAASEWQKQVTYFAGAGFRVTTYDMRGHGESDKPAFGYRISRFATDLDNLLKELNLKNVTIVGHSMGCSVAWAWWDQYPASHKRIHSLVLVDQAAVMVRDPHWTDEEAAEYSSTFTPQIVYDLANDMANQLPGLVEGMFTDTVSSTDLAWVLSQNLKMSDANSASLLIDHAFRDWRDVLPRIDVPTLTIAGNLSIFPPQGIEWVASQIPDAEHYTFTAAEKGSHFMFWENSVRFNQVVEDFLAAL